MAKILIVEDDSNLSEMIFEILQAHGHEVETAQDGKIASGLLEGGRYDVILSDINMPNMNGVELSKFASQTDGVPVILMTGYSHLIEGADMANSGATSLLKKPFSVEDLIEEIDRVLGVAA